MKRILFSLNFILLSLSAFSQGLEGIVVEKYYISDANDTMANPDGGILPIGSVTYRIYVDMLPGYKFQAVYGVPGHELRLATTTAFFNNIDRGAVNPTYTKAQASHNTVMLDSWLSVGAACAGNYGILKSQDDGVANVANSYSPQVLQNNNSDAGIPLTMQDGLIAGSPEPVTMVGFNGADSIFDATNMNGNLLSTWNASWASLNGSMGPDTIDNKVLIAQMTTDGVFSFKLNVQIRTTDTSGNPVVEQYVADSAVGSEIQFSPLIQSFDPSVLGISSYSGIKNGLKVFPNPAGNFVTVRMNPGKPAASNFYLLYDEEGELILKKEVGAVSSFFSGTIDLSSLSCGLYMLEFISDGVISTERIIKN